MASGGSGGHIYPSLALAKILNKNHEVSFIGYKKHMEDKVIDKNKYNFYGINKKKKYLGLYSEYRNIKKEIKKIKPDLVIGWGNSLSFLSLLAAKRCHIKTILHEQNIIPGKANKLASYFVDDSILSFQDTLKYIKQGKVFGNPRGEEALNSIKSDYKLSKDKANILIVMGSLGSSSVTSFMIDLLNKVKFDAHFIISIGKNVKLKTEFNKLNDIDIYEYIESMPSLMRDVDLLISRAGATTISEIEALNVVSLLIPSPYVTNNHQYLNAKYMFDKGLAMMVEEKDLNEKIIRDYINDKKMQLKIKMNLMKEKKKKGITDFVNLINDKYSK